MNTARLAGRPRAAPAALARRAARARAAPPAAAPEAAPPAAPPPPRPLPPGRFLGAIALVTGSTVGGGVLALPAVTAPAGLGPSTAALVGGWAILFCQALLMTEVNLALLASQDEAAEGDGGSGSGSGSGSSSGADSTAAAAFDGNIVTLRQMAAATLGAPGGALVPAVYLALSYALLVAYLAKAGELLTPALGLEGLGAGAAPGAALAAAAAAALLSRGAAAGVAANQALTGALLALFGGVVVAAAPAPAALAAALGLGPAAAPSLAASSLALPPALCAAAAASGNWCWAALPPAAPIVFLSLVYHDLVPYLCSYLGRDRGAVTRALAAGSALPLALFVAWEAAALAPLAALPPAQGAALVEIALGAAAPPAARLMPAASAGAETGAALAAAPPLADAVVLDPGAGTLAALPPQAPLDPVELLARRVGPGAASALAAFSLLAVGTSLVGTALGLSETLRAEAPAAAVAAARLLGRCGGADAAADDAACAAERPAEGDGLAAPLALALLPPLAAAALDPGAFLSFLAGAGGYGMALLYGALPPAMAWRLRAGAARPLGGGASERVAPGAPLVGGGAPALAALCASGLAVAAARAAAEGGAAGAALPAACAAACGAPAALM
jgi:tyrosine-specific transport protein